MNLRVFLTYYRLFPDRKLNVLRSFGMLNHEDYAFCFKHRDKINSMILDSGTWTLNNAKGDIKDKITLQNYINYAKTVRPYYDRIANFDATFTDDGFESNYYNQLILEKAGLDPFPVVHDIYGQEIDHYISKGYDLVSLGSSQITSVDTLAYVMERFEGTGIKIHLFGNAKFEFLANFPIHSCDTAMWARTGGYGWINYWNPKKEGADKTDSIYMEEYLDEGKIKKITFPNYEFREDLEKFLLETLNVTYLDLMGPHAAYCKMLVNTCYYAQLEDIVNQIHRQKGFDTMR